MASYKQTKRLQKSKKIATKGIRRAQSAADKIQNATRGTDNLLAVIDFGKSMLGAAQAVEAATTSNKQAWDELEAGKEAVGLERTDADLSFMDKVGRRLKGPDEGDQFVVTGKEDVSYDGVNIGTRETGHTYTQNQLKRIGKETIAGTAATTLQEAGVDDWSSIFTNADKPTTRSGKFSDKNIGEVENFATSMGGGLSKPPSLEPSEISRSIPDYESFRKQAQDTASAPGYEPPPPPMGNITGEGMLLSTSGNLVEQALGGVSASLPSGAGPSAPVYDNTLSPTPDNNINTQSQEAGLFGSMWKNMGKKFDSIKEDYFTRPPQMTEAEAKEKAHSMVDMTGEKVVKKTKKNPNLLETADSKKPLGDSVVADGSNNVTDSGEISTTETQAPEDRYSSNLKDVVGGAKYKSDFAQYKDVHFAMDNYQRYGDQSLITPYDAAGFELASELSPSNPSQAWGSKEWTDTMSSKEYIQQYGFGSSTGGVGGYGFEYQSDVSQLPEWMK